MATPTKLSRPQTTSASPASPLRSSERLDIRAKTSPASKIPSPPKRTSSVRESRERWRPPGINDLSSNGRQGPASTPSTKNGWKPPETADTRPRSAVYKGSGVPTSSPNKPFSKRNHLPSVSSPLVSKLPTTKPESRGTFPASWKNPKNSTPSWWGAESIPLVELMRRQNPNVDRSPAVLNEPCVSKLFIKLRNPYGRPIEREYPNSMDWSCVDRIHALNRWRNKTFEYYLGPAEGEEVRPHALENALVLEAHRELESAAEAMHPFVGKRLPSWAGIAQDFNDRFEGKKLDGDEDPRPRMTREMLRRRFLVPLEDADEKGTTRSSLGEVFGRAASERQSREASCGQRIHSAQASRISSGPKDCGAPKPVRQRALSKQLETKSRTSNSSPVAPSTGNSIRSK